MKHISEATKVQDSAEENKIGFQITHMKLYTETCLLCMVVNAIDKAG